VSLGEGALEVPEGPKVWRLTVGGGLSLHVEEWGSRHSAKTPVLCLPGLTRNAHDFETTARRLSAERRVVAFDYRGRGRSDFDPDPANYNGRTYLGDISQICSALNLHGYLAIGTSMGGLLAFGLGVLMPAALRGVLINDIGPAIGSSGTQRILDYVGRDHPAKDWEEAKTIIASTYPEGSYPRAEDATWAKIAKTSYKPGADGLLHVSWDTALAKALKEQDDDFDLWKLFGSLRGKPVTLLRGENSDLLSEATAKMMAMLHGRMGLVTVAGTPHAPTLDEPESVKAIDDLLKNLDRNHR
jgi:pimeloyl-ACP methyl ester carboxylesterase